jgi:chemotaxis signal transduction protein
MRLLMISIGGGRFAVPADAVTRILDPAIEDDLRILPGGRRATWRGREIRVVDPLARPADGGAPGRIYLVIEVRGDGVLLPVEAAEAIQDVPADAIAPLPDFIFARPGRTVRGVFAGAAGPRLLLDEAALR